MAFNTLQLYTMVNSDLNIWEYYDLMVEDTNRPDQEYLDWQCDYYHDDQDEEDEAIDDWLNDHKMVLDNCLNTGDGQSFVTMEQYRERKRKASELFWSQF